MQGTSVASLVKIGQAVSEKKSFEQKVDNGRTDNGHQAITRAHHEHFVLR
jgi:hypothetical protein